MAIISRLAVAASRAWGQFSSSAQGLANFLYTWGSASGDTDGNRFGNYSVGATITVSSPVQISSFKYNDLSRSNSHSLAIRPNGTLWAWGSNNIGQLGDGTTAVKSYQTQIGTLTNWSKVATGNDQSAAIKTDGTLWTWGYGGNGALGDGTTVNKSSPVQIGTLTNWAYVSAGDSFAVAVKTDGTLWAWGSGASGRLGDGTSVNKSSPIQVGTLTNWSYVQAGPDFCVALKTDNTLWAWGVNALGQLGDGTTTVKSSPVQIGTLNTWASIGIAGNASLAIKNDGTLWAWGGNGAGQLGDGTTTNRSSPVQIGTLTNWLPTKEALNKSLSAASYAIKNDGTFWAWGSGGNGLLGDGTTVNKSSPVQIGTLTNWAKVCGTAAALDSESYPLLWWLDTNGRLGRTTSSLTSPTPVGRQFKAIKAVGLLTTSAIDNDGKLYGWGLNTNGTIGDGTTISKSAPIQIGTQTDWADIEASGLSAMSAIKTDDTQYTWGNVTDGYTGTGFITVTSTWLTPLNPYTDNTYKSIATGFGITALVDTSGRMYVASNGTGNGLNGIGTTLSTEFSPVQVNSSTDWDGVSVGAGFALTTKNDGTLWAWGQAGAYAFGQNVTGVGGTLTSPVLMNQGPGYVKLIENSQSRSNSGAIDSQGRAWLWGAESGNQLTIDFSGVGVVRSTPNQEQTLSTDWDKLFSSTPAYIGKKNNGSLWAWGGGSQRGIGNVSSNLSPTQIGTVTTWSNVSMGEDHVLATQNDGTLWAWGNNDFGQLGIGNTNVRYSPSQVGTLTNWSKVYAGIYHSLAVKTDGTLWAWGFNGSGQLGNGDTVDLSSPVQIGTLTNWANAAAGQNVSAAVKTDGTLWNWGSAFGMGDGSGVAKSSPVQIGTLTTWSKAIATGRVSVFAFKNDNSMWAWGRNDYGQLGVGTTIDPYSSPVQVGTLSWANVAGSINGWMQGITTNNEVYFWGDNADGNANSLAPTLFWPTQIGTLTNWSKVKAGVSNGIAIKTDGSLWAWGRNNEGQLGDGTTVNKFSPIQVGTLTTWTQVSASNFSSFAIRNDNTIWSWGRNQYGKLGLGDTLNKSSPIQVGTLTNWQSLSNLGPGTDTTHALKSDGTLWGWGLNTNAQIGDSSTVNKSSPVQIGTLTNWAAIANDSFSSVFVDTSGVVYQTGFATATATLANGAIATVSSPVQIGTGYGTTLAAAGLGIGGNGAIMMLKTGGKAYAWGLHSASTPMAVSQAIVTTPTQLEETGWASEYVKNDGSLWMWGLNSSGQLGTGNTLSRFVPQQIGTLTDWSKVSVYSNNTAAIKTNGSLWTWGLGAGGALGTGSTVARSSPVQVGTLTNWASVSAGASYCIAIKTDGTLWSWGLNSSGQLGDGTTTNKSSPVQIGTLTNWTYAVAYGISSFAARSDGTLWAWGENSNGQLGNGGFTDISSPVQIGTTLSWEKPVYGGGITK